MTISREDLEHAVFWDRLICLDCGSETELEDDDAEGAYASHGPCGECGSPRTFLARAVKQIVERVADE